MDLQQPHPTSQLTLVGEIVVQPLKSSEVSKAATTWENAFVEDPAQRYMQAGRKPDPVYNLLRRLLYTALLRSWRRRQVVLTVDAGAALVVYSPTYQDPSQAPRVERLLRRMIAIVNKIKNNKEQQKRTKEYEMKLKNAVSRFLGDRANEMAALQLLCTDPASQGRGYGGALTDSVTKLSDLAVRDTWLLSSNIMNTAFYESHGFNAVADIVLGDDNPEWHEPPVIIKLMIREHHDMSMYKGMA